MKKFILSIIFILIILGMMTLYGPIKHRFEICLADDNGEVNFQSIVSKKGNYIYYCHERYKDPNFTKCIEAYVRQAESDKIVLSKCFEQGTLDNRAPN